MNRAEFIEKLQRALAGGLSSGQVAENVRYYQEYIDSEVRKGKREAEVLASLGDPRLLAKSIIEANKRAGASYGSNREYDEEVSGEAESVEDEAAMPDGRVFMLPGWLIMLILTVVVVVIIGLATALFSVFAPVIIAVLAVILIVKIFQRH